MKLPYVIDNQSNKLADILNTVMAAHAGSSLDVATAYFNVGGYRLLSENLKNLRSFRLLLGSNQAKRKTWACAPGCGATWKARPFPKRRCAWWKT